jgi:hypothetical protein
MYWNDQGEFMPQTIDPEPKKADNKEVKNVTLITGENENVENSRENGKPTGSGTEIERIPKENTSIEEMQTHNPQGNLEAG